MQKLQIHFEIVWVRLGPVPCRRATHLEIAIMLRPRMRACLALRDLCTMSIQGWLDWALQDKSYECSGGISSAKLDAKSEPGMKLDAKDGWKDGGFRPPFKQLAAIQDKDSSFSRNL